MLSTFSTRTRGVFGHKLMRSLKFREISNIAPKVHLEVDQIVKELSILGGNSNLEFDSEAWVHLDPNGVEPNPPFVLFNKNGIIPAVDPNEDKLCFSTRQFMQLLLEDENINTLDYWSEVGGIHNEKGHTTNDLREYFLHERMIKAIDDRRKELTIENLESLSGHCMSGIYDGSMTREEAIDEYPNAKDINYEFIEFMNKCLYNNSIITVPTDLRLNIKIEDCVDERLHKFCVGLPSWSKHSENWPEDTYKWTHEHCIVGATKDGHIIGWTVPIVWT